jgi:type II secretory pathway pseudopilin PulG
MQLKKVQTEKRSPAGFSLIELLVAMVIVIVIIGFVAGMITGIQREFNDQRPRMEALNNVSMAMDTVVRIVRMAGSKNASCTGLTLTPLLPSAPAGSGVYNALQVQADWNPPDCSLSGVDEDVNFSVSNGIFYLDAARSEPFAENIKAVRFKFYDSGNALITDAVTDAANITYVGIEFETNDDTATVLRSGVRLRSK